MTEIKVKKGEFPTYFGGFGFHNNEAMFYPIIEREHFNQKICKCYREISPGFMRTFGGFSDWSKEHMDAFAEYYEKMQKWTDTPIYFACAKGKYHFSDEERMQYAEDVAKNLDYLINEKGVKQLRYYCFSNEMSMNDWGGLLKDLPLFHKYHEMLFRAFQNRGLRIGLLATDASDIGNWDTLDYAINHMRRITEDFCLHTYCSGFEDNLDFYQKFYKLCYETCVKCCECDGKRLILGEFGIKRSDSFRRLNGVIKDVNAYNYTGDGAYIGLRYAEAALAAINAGVFAMVIWTFVDYPDPYTCHYAERDPFAQKWGMCEPYISETQDVKYNKYGLMKWEDDGDYSVREMYWALGLISKYCKRNAKVLDIENDDPLVRIAALLNRDGSISVAVVNRHVESTPLKLKLELKHMEKQQPMRVYEYDSHNVCMNEFGDLQDPSAILTFQNANEIEYTLLPESLTVFTTDYKSKEKEIFAKKVARKDNWLSWQPVEDAEHCYYRVYRGKTPDFRPCFKNQIASTVDTSIDFSARYLDDAAILNVEGNYYKVLSVDRSGNGLLHK
ncbi:MAG: hypothetical protein E7329_05810 [Clostridiales bacterium]|nr:hypothetical protein [Clostridiales bacterium]